MRCVRWCPSCYPSRVRPELDVLERERLAREEARERADEEAPARFCTGCPSKHELTADNTAAGRSWCKSYEAGRRKRCRVAARERVAA